MSDNTIPQPAQTALAVQQQHSTPVPVFTWDEVVKMAQVASRTGILGKRLSVEDAIVLLLTAQSEGLHPMQALRQYHIIDGRASLSSEAMLARHQISGGKCQWVERSAERAEAHFIGPLGSATIVWDKARAMKAGLWEKANFKKHPDQMLSARVASEGVRATNPAVIQGFYTPEEVQFFDRPADATLPAEVGPDGRADFAAVPLEDRQRVNAQIEDAVAGQRRFQDTPQEAEFVDVPPAEPAPPPPAAESQEVEIDIVAFDAETSPGKTLCKTFDKIKPPAGRLSDAVLVYPGALPADIAARVLETAAPWRVRATVRCTGNKNRAGELIYGVQRGPDNSLQFELVEEAK